jgi:hypothetical protein
MPKHTKPKVPEKADDKEQSEAFIKAAQELQTDDDPALFEKAFSRVTARKKSRKRTSPQK